MEEGNNVVQYWVPVLWGVIVLALVLIVFGSAIQREKHARVPKSILFRIAEHIYLFIEQMCLNVIGPHGRKYIPFVGTMFVFVLFSNLFGLTGLPSPTAHLSINIGLAVTVFLYVQYEGIRANGPLGYLKHFWGPLAMIGPLMFVVEVVSEFAKVVSLSVRLYGNMYGEHEVNAMFRDLVHVGGFPVPLNAPLLLLAIFTCLIQALVFGILTAIYLGLMTSHEGSDHAAQEAH